MASRFIRRESARKHHELDIVSISDLALVSGGCAQHPGHPWEPTSFVIKTPVPPPPELGLVARS
jgi:hypothetical protein